MRPAFSNKSHPCDVTARACGLKAMDLRSDTSKMTKDTSNMTDVPS